MTNPAMIDTIFDMNERHFLRLSLLLIISFFWFSKPIELIWDDQLLIGLNPWTSHLHSIRKIWLWDLWHQIPGEHADHWYRPIMALHLILDQQLFGDHLLPRQLCSLVWFLGLCHLVWKYLERWQLPAQHRQLGFALFLFHPFQLELIHFLAARNDTMVFFFSLSAIFARSKWATVSFLLLALLSKESALIIIPLLLFGEFLRGGNWKISALMFGLMTLAYLSWKQYLGLPAYFPESDALLPLISTILKNICFPWDAATAGFAIPQTSLFLGLFSLFVLGIQPMMQRNDLYIFALIFILITIILAALAAASSHSLSYRYTTLPLFGLTLLLSNLRLSAVSRKKHQIIAILFGGFILTGFIATHSQWKDSRSLWSLAHERTPSSHTACGLFMQSKQEPFIALQLLEEATNHPPAQHCCFHASQYPLDVHSPERSIELGKKSLRQGCLRSPELMAPLALSEALLGNWIDARAIAQQLQKDPYGYSPLILTAEGLRREDTTALDYWSQNNPAAREQLRTKAEQLIQMGRP